MSVSDKLRNADGDDINEMVSKASTICCETFLKYLEPGEWDVAPYNSKDFPLDKDWHVAYYRSEYRGIPCVYYVYSAIAYIFY